MSEFDFLRGASLSSSGAETAHAFVIRATPDLFARETLNVGVCVLTAAGERLARCISTPGRLNCLYDESGAKLIVEMANSSARRFKLGQSSDTEQVQFVDIGPVYNISPQQAVDALFHDLVTVATITKKEHDAKSAENEDALAEGDWVKQVHGLLRLRHPLDAERIIPKEQSVRIASTRGEFDVPVHVVGRNRFGRIVVASQTPKTVQKNLIFALADMERLAEEKNASVALFVGRSNADARTDDMVDYVYQRKTKAVRLEAEYTPEALTDHVEAWLSAA